MTDDGVIWLWKDSSNSFTQWFQAQNDVSRFLSGAGAVSDSAISDLLGIELDQGRAHNHDDTPFVLIGGGGGKLNTGQLIQFPLNLASGSDGEPTGIGSTTTCSLRYLW
jgi:hypothetical protein